MNVLILGDVVSAAGCAKVRRSLPALKKLEGVDLCIANGENAAKGNGITPEAAEDLFASGVDCITLGNHAFRRREIYDYLDRTDCIVRPFNYPAGAPGRGFTVLDLGYVRVGVLNLMGTMYLEALENPFHAADRALMLAREADCRILLADFHAEATSEKLAMGYYLDGKVSAVFGTHTHVQTSDARVLPGGTGYITDLGMCGPVNGILGVKKEIVIEKLRTNLPQRFDTDETDDCKLEGCLFEIDRTTGRCLAAQALRLE